MGCDISILAPYIYSTLSTNKVVPVSNTTRKIQTSPSITAIGRPKTVQSNHSIASSIDSQPIEQQVRPRVLSTVSTVASIMSLIDTRPPSGSSNVSFTRVYKNSDFSRNFTIDTSRCKSNLPVVQLCSKKIGIQEYPNGRTDGRPCDIYWHNVVYNDMRNMIKSPHSRVNKFPGMTELAKKIPLTHSISSMQRLFPSEYSFYPKSWFLPAHLKEFQKFCLSEKEKRKKSGNDENMWFIVKPDEGAQGTGIYLINNPEGIRNTSQKQLVQEYIADPYLMSDKLKFDFRVYGVIRSINPLSIYVAREGMARFCTEKYSPPSSSNFDNLYSHLTNYSLNKANLSYKHSTSLHEQIKGSKRLLSTVFHQLDSKGLKTKKLWHDIKIILVKTVLAMLPEIMLHYEEHFHEQHGPQCFQIIGFDIMIRSDGTPILLEVNSAPSLSIDHLIPTNDNQEQKVPSIVDQMIKVPLVKDTLLLVLGLMEEEYGTGQQKIGSGKNGTSRSVDDMNISTTKARRPHLSEIFPARYGSHSGHLLFLDKAMYIYMQFVHLRNNINITSSGMKQFIKKCNLSNVISQQELDLKMTEINYYFTGDMSTISNGLPFHAFLQFLFYVAEQKFVSEDDLLAKTQRLLTFCDTSLRHYGVRSARLRRTEIDSNMGDTPIEIYMLPNRMKANKRSKSSEVGKQSERNGWKSDTNNNNSLSLPKIKS